MSKVTGNYPDHGWFSRIVDGEVQSYFSFQFNPTEDERSRSVEYAFMASPGSSLPVAVFKNINGDEMSLELFLDATDGYSAEREGVSAMIAELESYTHPVIEKYSSDLGQFIPPPMVRYGMGKEYWDVVVTKFSSRVVRRNRKLYPTRAYVNLDMRAIFTTVAAIQDRLARLQRLRNLVALQDG